MSCDAPHRATSVDAQACLTRRQLLQQRRLHDRRRAPDARAGDKQKTDAPVAQNEAQSEALLYLLYWMRCTGRVFG